MGKPTVIAFVALVALGCAGGVRRVNSQGEKEPLVPPAQVEASKELMGTQQSFMTDLNRTDSEEAGARHEADQKPVQQRPVEKGPQGR